MSPIAAMPLSGRAVDADSNHAQVRCDGLRAVRVLIISDIRLYREGLAELLARDGRLRLAGSAASVESALGHLQNGDVGVVLLDMGIPESLAAVRAIAAACRLASTRVVALGISETHEDVVRCAEAGARGYVCRESSLDDLVAAVHCAVDGEVRCPPRIVAALMDSVARLATRMTVDDGAPLTDREIEIAELLGQGLGNREIALRLHISVATVKVHVHHILEKLGARRRGEAASKLRRAGLLQPQRLLTLPRITPIQPQDVDPSGFKIRSVGVLRHSPGYPHNVD